MRDVKIKICDVRDAEVAKYCEQQGVCFLGIHQIKYPYDMYLHPGIISVVDIDNIEEYDKHTFEKFFEKLDDVERICL